MLKGRELVKYSTGKMQQVNNEDGFTLVELLVVILIIGILAAIAVPVFLNQRNKALDASIESNAHSINQALMLYGLREGTLPHQGPLASDGMEKEGNPEKLLGLSIAETTHPKATPNGSYFPEARYGPWMEDNVYNYRAFSSDNSSCWNTNARCDSYILSYKLANGEFKTSFGTLKPEACRQNVVSVLCT